MKLLTSLIFGTAVACSFTPADAQVWKCVENGRTVFSDQPCPATGRQMDPRKLNGNSVQAERVPMDQGDDAPLEFSTQAGVARQSPQNSCPSDQDIRNMETKASSMTLGKKEKAFMDDEIRRARQCRKGQGNYAAEDWQVSREAQDDQNSLTNKQRGRSRAEGMHSAADPIEGDRIEQRRLADEARRREEQAIAAAAAAQRALQQNETFFCNPRGCTSSTGGFYSRSAKGTFVGPRGTCTLAGTQLMCL